MLRQDRDVVQQQVAEVAGVQRAQSRLIGRVEALALAVGEILGRRQLVRGPPPVLPVIDQARQRTRRPPLCVDVGRFQQLLQQPLLVVGIQDGEGRLQPDQFGVAAQDLGGDGVKGAEPAQTLRVGADQMGDPLAHLACGLVGEGDGQELPRPCAARRQDVRQPGRQHAGLAGARARQHQNRPLGRLHSLPLLRVQAGEIVVRRRKSRGRPRARQIGDTGKRQVGHGGRVTSQDG